MLIHTAAMNRGAHTNIVQVHTLRNALQARFLRLNDALVLLRNLHFSYDISVFFTISVRRSHPLLALLTLNKKGALQP